MIHFTVPSIPPSVNHYRGYNRRNGRWYVRKEALAFKIDVAVCLGVGRKMPDAKAYRVDVVVYLPKGKRGDSDNFLKVILDALQSAGAIPNDSRVQQVQIEKRRDPANPRTEITISVIDNNPKPRKEKK